MAILKRLKVVIKTSSAARAGTDATTYLLLCLAQGSRIYPLPTRKEDMEAGRKDIYEFLIEDGPELGDVRAIVLVNGMNGPDPAWKVLWIGVEATDAEGTTWQLVDAMLDRWLDHREGRAPAAVLPLAEPPVRVAEHQNVNLPGLAVRSL